MRRLGQRVAQTESQREDMYIFGEEAADLDSQLGACAEKRGKIVALKFESRLESLYQHERDIINNMI